MRLWIWIRRCWCRSAVADVKGAAVEAEVSHDRRSMHEPSPQPLLLVRLLSLLLLLLLLLLHRDTQIPCGGGGYISVAVKGWGGNISIVVKGKYL